MLYEYGIYGSVLIAFLTVFHLSIAMPLAKSLLNKKDDLNPVAPKILEKFNTNIKITYFLLVTLTSIKIFYLITFPSVVLSQHGVPGIPNIVLLNYLIQSLALAVYVTAVFLLFLHNKLKPEHKFGFTLQVFKFIAIVAFFDGVIHLLLSFYQEHLLLWPGSPLGSNGNENTWFRLIDSNASPNWLLFLALITFAAYFLMSLISGKKHNQLYHYLTFWIFVVAFIVLLLLSVNESFLLQRQLWPAGNLLKLFHASHGFLGLIWLILIYLAFCSQILSFKMVRLRDRFLFIQLNAHYRIRLSRIALWSFSLLLIMNLWVEILKLYYQ